jgi:hypothetical protein
MREQVAKEGQKKALEQQKIERVHRASIKVKCHCDLYSVIP